MEIWPFLELFLAFSRRPWLNSTLSHHAQVIWVYVCSDIINNHGIFSHHSDTQVPWVVCSDVNNNHMDAVEVSVEVVNIVVYSAWSWVRIFVFSGSSVVV
jgi:hypothetical protein